MIRIVLLGAGNVATHLIKAFSASSETEIIMAYNRSKTGLKHLDSTLKTTSDIDTLPEADCYIIAVPDDAVAKLSHSLPFSGKLVVHTSGSVNLQETDAKNRRGVFYPLQTFSKNREVDFSEIPICLEAEDETDYNLLKKMASAISVKQYQIDSAQRKQLHLAAVFVCNFVNYLYHTGYQITAENNISFDILKPLIQETASKIEKATPAEMQTGPAKRNDKKTMEKHLEALTLPEHKEIYTLLSQAIINTYGGKEL